MGSPDVANYLGLDLITLDEQTLVDTALADGVEKFPDWEPREGNTEVVLIEQLAALVAELGYLGNAIPDSTAEVLLRLLGYTRSPGSPATAILNVTVTDGAGHTIPAGTAFRVDLGEGTDPVDLILDEDLIIPEGDAEGTGQATGNEATTRANGVAAGTALEVLDAVAYIDTVTVLDDPIGGGTDPEDGIVFLERVGPRLAGLTTTIVRPVDVATAVLAQFPAVLRINVRDAGNSSYVDPGAVVVYVMGTAGTTALSGPAKLAIGQYLVLRMHGGLTLSVIDGTVQALEVATTVTRLANYTEADVEAAVYAAITGYLDPATYPWSNIVKRNELIAIVDAVPGVDTVDALTLAVQGEDPVATDLDLVLSGPEDFQYLVQATGGAVAVTVEDPS